MVNGLFIMSEQFIDLVYPLEVQQEIKRLVHIYRPPLTTKDIQENPTILEQADVIFSGWGGPKMDAAFLEAAPRLETMFYAAGTIKSIVTDASWERGITITTAADANAVPVAEYTLSQILFTLKDGWQFVRNIRKEQVYPAKPFTHLPGAFGSTVGLISLSTVGRKVAKLLQAFDLNVLAYDPFAREEDAAALGVQLVSLEEIFKQSDVVSLHTPLLPETVGMIKGEHFATMKPHASFINTARGAIVCESEMVEQLQQRPDITAILDVTNPEPPETGSLLYSLPNVVLTPHLAGSEGKECGRLGTYMLEELKRYIANEPLQWAVNRKQFESMA